LHFCFPFFLSQKKNSNSKKQSVFVVFLIPFLLSQSIKKQKQKKTQKV